MPPRLLTLYEAGLVIVCHLSATRLLQWDVWEGRLTGELGSSRLSSLQVRKVARGGVGRRASGAQTKPELRHALGQERWSAVASRLWVCFGACSVFSNALHFNDTWLFWGRAAVKLIFEGVARSFFPLLFFPLPLFHSCWFHSQPRRTHGSSPLNWEMRTTKSVRVLVCSCHTYTWGNMKIERVCVCVCVCVCAPAGFRFHSLVSVCEGVFVACDASVWEPWDQEGSRKWGCGLIQSWVGALIYWATFGSSEKPRFLLYPNQRLSCAHISIRTHTQIRSLSYFIFQVSSEELTPAGRRVSLADYSSNNLPLGVVFFL